MKISSLPNFSKKKDQLEIAGKFCLLQPCEVKEDFATGRCYGCKIGSSIKNAHEKALEEVGDIDVASGLKINCDFCHKELTELGAILLSPPDKNSMVRKKHMCKNCFDRIEVGVPSVFDLEATISLTLSQLLIKDEVDRNGYTKAKVIAEKVHNLIIQKRAE